LGGLGFSRLLLVTLWLLVVVRVVGQRVVEVVLVGY
jgi:hypothetical protein